jgi:hypothetical protein
MFLKKQSRLAVVNRVLLFSYFKVRKWEKEGALPYSDTLLLD